MIAVVIIGILAAITIPSLIGSQNAVNGKLALSTFSQIKQAQQVFKDDLNYGRYGTLDELRNTRPGGNSLIEEKFFGESGRPASYKGWILEQIEDPTDSTFGVKLIPAAGNQADFSYFMYERGSIRRTNVNGPYERTSGTEIDN